MPSVCVSECHPNPWVSTGGRFREVTKKEAALTPAKGISHQVALEALGRLHALTVERFDARRRLEWRLSVTMWGGLVLTANVIKDLELPRWAGIVGIVLLAKVVLLHAAWERWYVLRAAVPNRDQGYVLENSIRAAVGLDEVQAQSRINWAAHYWQVVITALLALLVVAAGLWGANPI